MIKTTAEAEAALNKLADALSKIKRTKKLNIFDAVGMATQEVKHSAFLAWLLNPNATPGQSGLLLGDFLAALLTYRSKSDAPNVPSNAEIISDTVTAADIAALVADEKIEVTTEKVVDQPNNRIDIFIRSEKAKLTVVIENKTFTSTHDDQLSRYENDVKRIFPDEKYIFVYLTPDGDIPTDINKKPQKGWCIFDYSAIVELLRGKLAEIKSKRNTKLAHLTEDYKDMVDDKILHNNPTIRALCKKIRREHADALKILMDYTDNVDAVYKYIAEQWLPGNVRDIAEFIYEGRKLVFYTKPIAGRYARSGLDMKTDDGLFRFQMSVGSKDGPITLSMWLSKPATADWTDADMDILKIVQPNKTPGAKYCTLYSVEIFSEEDRETVFDSDDALRERINKTELKKFSDKIAELHAALSAE